MVHEEVRSCKDGRHILKDDEKKDLNPPLILSFNDTNRLLPQNIQDRRSDNDSKLAVSRTPNGLGLFDYYETTNLDT